MQKENFLSEKVFAFESPSAVVSGVLSASPKVPSWYTQNAYVEKVEVDNVATTKEKQNRVQDGMKIWEQWDFQASNLNHLSME